MLELLFRIYIFNLYIISRAFNINIFFLLNFASRILVIPMHNLTVIFPTVSSAVIVLTNMQNDNAPKRTATTKKKKTQRKTVKWAREIFKLILNCV